MKRLIIIRGASGVGKTSIAKELSKRLGTRTAHVPVDLTPLNLLVDYQKIPKKQYTRLMYDNAEDMIRNFLTNNISVITDAMFTLKDGPIPRLIRMIRLGKRYGAKVTVFELHAKLDTIRERAKQRSRPEDVGTEYRRIDSRNKRFLMNRYMNAIKIDTDNKTSQQIVDELLSYIRDS
jgi:predicted kinase